MCRVLKTQNVIPTLSAMDWEFLISALLRYSL